MTRFCMLDVFTSPVEKRDSLLAKIFTSFSEEIVRIWSEMDSAPWRNLGRPTLRLLDEDYQGQTTKRTPPPPTLDFAFQSRADGKVFVVEMKCEITWGNYGYLTLEHDRQVQRHIDEQTRYGKVAFPWFADVARHPDTYKCTIKDSFGRNVPLKLPIAGAILVWGRVTEEARRTVIDRFGFHDVLSVELIINDLLRDSNPQYLALIDQRTEWFRQMFAGLRGTGCDSGIR